MRYSKVLFSLLSSLIYIFSYAQTCPTIKDDQGNLDEVSISCGYFSGGENCLNLTAQFPGYRSTDVYKTSKINYSPKTAFNAGVPINKFGDDVYLKRLNFNDAIFSGTPFSFSFYGKVYPSLLISSNGFITFNQTFQEGDFSTADIADHPIPDPYLPGESIFGVFQDLDVSKESGSQIYLNVSGTAPCRTLTISFYNAKIANTEQLTTTQIVLYEGSNSVEINIEKKPLPDNMARHREAVVGITDADGDGIAAAGRNNEIFAAYAESWKFEPAGRGIGPRYQWYKDNQPLKSANRNYLKLCPTNLVTSYKVIASYNLPSGDIQEITKNFEVKYQKDFPLVKNYSEVFCAGNNSAVYQSSYNPKVSYNPIGSFNFKYYSNLNAAQVGGNAEFDPATPLDRNQVYFVRVESKSDATCFGIAELKLSDISNALVTNTLSVCDSNNDGIERDYELSQLLCQILPEGLNFTNPKFFVGNNTTPITKPDLSPQSKLYVEITTSCGTTRLGPLNVVFTNAPQVKRFSSPVPIDLCDIVTYGNGANYEPNFDWVQYFNDRNIALSNDAAASEFQFFATKADAINNIKPLTVIREGRPNTNPSLDYVYSVFARVGYAATDECLGSCFSVVEVPVKVKFNRIILNVNDTDTDAKPDDPTIFDPETADIYFCKDGSRNVNLKKDSEDIIAITQPQNGTGITVTYHENYPQANDPQNLGVSPDQTIADRLTAKTFYIRYHVGNDPANVCYVVKPLRYRYIDFSKIKSQIQVCNTVPGTDVSVTLADYTNEILTSAYRDFEPKLEFFQDPNASTPITSLKVNTVPKTVYVKITAGVNAACVEILPVSFVTAEVVSLKKEVISIDINCDNNNDGKESFNLNLLKADFVNDETDFTITYYKDFNPANGSFRNPILASDADDYTVTDGLTVYARILKKGTRCVQKGEVKFNIKNVNKPIILDSEAVIVQCDITGQSTTFNLEDAVTSLYSSKNPPYENYISAVTFFNTEKDANDDVSSIASVIDVPISEPRKEVWARFETTTGCYSVAKIVLRIINKGQLKPQKQLEPVCDDNLDGTYKINLKDWLEKNRLRLFDDPEISLGAKITFHKEEGVPALTEQEIINFHPDPYTQKDVYMIADFNGCKTGLRLDFDFGDISDPQEFTYGVVCENDPINLRKFEKDYTDKSAIESHYFRSKNNLIDGINEISNPESYNYEGVEKIYIKIIYPAGTCPKEAIIHIPDPKLAPELALNGINGGRPYEYCPYGEGLTIAPQFDIILYQFRITNYEWLDPSGAVIASGRDATSISGIKTPGIYTVRVTASNACIGNNQFEVKERDAPVITELIPGEDNYVVVASGSKPLLYAYSYIQNGQVKMSTWQSSRFFDRLPKGVLTFYVKYDGEDNLEACWASKQGLLPVFNNVITPNGDGLNDVWEVKDLGVFEGQKSTLQVFDRYGSLMFEESSADQFRWNGTQNGRIVPTSTYWYVVSLPDGRRFTGWILVKNRD